ncbi:ras-related and estrogen-regulated growth inhibitor-like protein, partial [Rhincodon typus]|uniref:ras-related and estrogen-regulated growth inhibitor-like protein n=1 Tax=Rhincodon typus TaxID=259920 RepID=UPI00202EF6E2
LAVRFLTRRFIGEYSHIETIYTHNVTIDGAETRFHVWDSPNPQCRGAMAHPSEQQMRWADGFVLVYSILDRRSFEVARWQLAWLHREAGSARAPVVLVANKTDLCHRRVVSVEEGRLLALGSGCAFLEVSVAESYHTVALAFQQLMAMVQGSRAVPKRAAGLRGIVRSMSAVFGGKRRVD